MLLDLSKALGGDCSISKTMWNINSEAGKKQLEVLTSATLCSLVMCHISCPRMVVGCQSILDLCCSILGWRFWYRSHPAGCGDKRKCSEKDWDFFFPFFFPTFQLQFYRGIIQMLCHCRTAHAALQHLSNDCGRRCFLGGITGVTCS